MISYEQYKEINQELENNPRMSAKGLLALMVDRGWVATSEKNRQGHIHVINPHPSTEHNLTRKSEKEKGIAIMTKGESQASDGRK